MVCKLMKKGLVGTAIGAAALAMLFGTSAPSYVRTALTRVRQSAQKAVPIEFEIEKARQEVARLKPAIDDGIDSLAKAMIQVEHLDAEIVADRAQLNQQGRELQALNDHLRTGDTHLTNGVAYTTKEIKTDLSRRMDLYKRLKESLTAKQETLKARQRSVIAARENLDAMKAARRDLLVRIEGIEARLGQIRASRATNDVAFDDSAVGRASQAVDELETKVEEMVRIDDLKGQYGDRGVSISIDPTRDVTREIDAEFGTASKPATTSSVDKF